MIQRGCGSPLEMSHALAAYLSEVEQGLSGLPRGRRRLFLRELESHLLDEAEARGIVDEAGMRTLVAEKESPSLLAREISSHDGSDTTHRNEGALLAGGLIGLATGTHLWIEHWPWFLCLGWCIALGLAVGAGFILIRRQWQRFPPGLRVAMAVVFGTLLAIPLGFTGTRGFRVGRLVYGAFLGYLLERHAQRRPVWHAVAETLAFTVLDFALDLFVLYPQHLTWFRWWWVPSELSFNFTLTFAVLGALALRRVLSERWLLATQEQH